MKTVEVRVKLTYDDQLMYSTYDQEAKEWFILDVLADELEVVSGQVGDVVATMHVCDIDELWEAAQ